MKHKNILDMLQTYYGLKDKNLEIEFLKRK